MRLEVLFTPLEQGALEDRDLGRTACVVFDVLRATSTVVTALQHGARAIRPVSTIEEAVAERVASPEVLLAGERGGVRISADLSGGVAFDLGNSPREFTRDRVAGRTLVMTTTNGTRALKACARARRVVAAAFLNLAAVADRLRIEAVDDALLVCAGTGERAAYEDTLAAGALCERLLTSADLADSALLAHAAWRAAANDLPAEIRRAENARRLLAHPELAPDVDLCLARDTCRVVPLLVENGELRAG